MKNFCDLNPPARVLLGPGPSMVPPRVLRAMAHPVVGHLDPEFLQVMADVQELLRYVFETENDLTIPISGTGSAAMEAALCNFIEPGDKVLIGVNGYFGERLCDMAVRYGARVQRMEKEWGKVFSPDDVRTSLQGEKVKLVGLVHAETSTGARQPLEGMADIAHQHGALLLVDSVASLGGEPVQVDEMGLDITYSGSQKCLSCPPGASPLTISSRAYVTLQNRETPVPNWYLDLTLLEQYWGEEHSYHHTAPISMIYALREALRLVHEEGLDNRFERHLQNARYLWDGLQAMGFEPTIPEAYRLTPLTTVQVPQGLDEARIRSHLLEEYNIEVAGGLGDWAGKVWRIGLMGYSSRKENVTLLLKAIRDLLG